MTYFDPKLTASVRLPASGLSFRRVGGALATLIDTLLDWQERARQRRQLLGLSDQALGDFGASRADAEREGGKAAWQ